MNVLSLFSGIGGFDLGLERAGCTIVGQVEIDPFCQRVLAARWPGVERASDIRENRLLARSSPGAQSQSEHIDLLVGGFPCQDLSVAGRRAGLRGERSGLFWEIVRIAKLVTPPWGLFENVPGLVSSHRGRDMETVLAGLRECWPAVGYRILDSQYFGVPQRRRRVFFVGGPTAAGVAQILALTEGGGGDSASGGQAGTDVARCLATGTNSARYDYESETFVTGPLDGGNDGIGRRSEDDPNLIVTHTLRAEGHDASEDGTGRGTPLVMPIQYVEQWGWDKRQNGVGIGQDGDPSFTLDASYPHGVASASLVRRLTPVECERLQAFPDGWTCLCQPLTAYAADPDAAALACRCPDSPRYRALGNAVTVNVIEWLGRRLMRAAVGG